MDLLKADLLVFVKISSFHGTVQQALQGFREKLGCVLFLLALHILTQEKGDPEGPQDIKGHL